MAFSSVLCDNVINNNFEMMSITFVNRGFSMIHVVFIFVNCAFVDIRVR